MLRIRQAIRIYWRWKMLPIGFAMAILITTGSWSLAQIQRLEQPDRDDRRAERRMDAIQKAHDDLRFDIEKRLTRIETYMNIGAWLLTGIAGVLVVQLGQGFVSLLAQRRAVANGKSEGGAP